MLKETLLPQEDDEEAQVSSFPSVRLTENEVAWTNSAITLCSLGLLWILLGDAYLIKAAIYRYSMELRLSFNECPGVVLTTFFVELIIFGTCFLLAVTICRKYYKYFVTFLLIIWVLCVLYLSIAGYNAERNGVELRTYCGHIAGGQYHKEND